MKSLLIAISTILVLSSCSTVSIRNYKPEELKTTERTIVGSFELFNEISGQAMQDCKITFLVNHGKDKRRYAMQSEDQGVILTWSETGSVSLLAVDCGDGSFALKFDPTEYLFDVDANKDVTYFGHLQIRGIFAGVTDSSAAMFGAIGMAIAGANRTNELKSIVIEDRWKNIEPTFRKLRPTLAKASVAKALFKNYKNK